MKRFEFKLQPLLKYRQYLERIAQQDTARAVMDVSNCEKEINHLELMYDQNADKIEEVAMEGIKAAELKQFYQYLDSVEISIKQEKLRKIELKKKLKEKLLNLKKKSVEKKSIELYREKLKTQYTLDAVKTEQKELDEIFSIKTAGARSNEKI